MRAKVISVNCWNAIQCSDFILIQCSDKIYMSTVCRSSGIVMPPIMVHRGCGAEFISFHNIFLDSEYITHTSDNLFTAANATGMLLTTVINDLFFTFPP